VRSRGSRPQRRQDRRPYRDAESTGRFHGNADHAKETTPTCRRRPTPRTTLVPVRRLSPGPPVLPARPASHQEPETSWENGNRGQQTMQLHRRAPSQATTGPTGTHFFRSK
jgi:hypothetical protein